MHSTTMEVVVQTVDQATSTFLAVVFLLTSVELQSSHFQELL